MVKLLIALGCLASGFMMAMVVFPSFAESLITAVDPSGPVTLPRKTVVAPENPGSAPPPPPASYEPRMSIDTSGFAEVVSKLKKWPESASLRDVSEIWKNIGYRLNDEVEKDLGEGKVLSLDQKMRLSLQSGLFLNYEGDTAKAYKRLEQAKALLNGKDPESRHWFCTFLFYQGVTAMRRGENENCIMCRGESSCILPISSAAVHTKPEGSRLAIQHFTEYLQRFPDDLEVRWLLNLAHMTLAEYPKGVDPKYLVPLDHWLKSEFDIGRFRDIGDHVGVNRMNQAGGAIMEDFDNDGLLDLVVTSFDPTQSMAFYHNTGNGTFDDRTESAGLLSQLGGSACMQGDYDNDGQMDIFIPRSPWIPHAVRPSLLRNNGDGTFEDVTAKANMLTAMNSNSAAWGDYDNDGFLDLYVCGERQPSLLYHNKGDGTFEEVANKARVRPLGVPFCKGATWIDYDNDRYPDLFLNFMGEYARLYRNNRDGTFADVTIPIGLTGPAGGFSCWSWDYDNDGFLDIFATCYDRTLKDIVHGLIGRPHSRLSNRLYRNLEGKGFKDVTKDAGLDLVFATMGSNFADFDNDGFLDMYLATGEPNLATLIPNRMFKNINGQRFAEITASSGTGNLQKGHGVACGDWDRDGDIDLFVEMGGTVNGDKYHNILFENPGQGNNWLTIKLVGQKSNRAAIGARVKAVTAGDHPLTVHRHVTSGSSFGANTLQQTLGLAKAKRIATLEIEWPTSGTKQVFHDLDANQAIEITEFAKDYRKLDWKPLPLSATSNRDTISTKR